MKLLPAALGLVLLLLLVLNPNGVEARPAPAGGHQKKGSSATFFVFGDDFADNGNLPPTDHVTEMSRQWAYPYGSNRSVALVAFSGNDYASTGVIGLSSPNDINAYIGKVTKEIAANVDQLLKLGVTKVLVNNLHPIGCTPSHTRTNNYTTCDIFGNLGASIHNDNLKQVMTSKKNVYIIDVYTTFTNIVDHVKAQSCLNNSSANYRRAARV
uniref:GDSL esterase/lipase n=1 Tax=Aegilops tauschii subsp. strangulata TaxID=200361 RepID=A0A453SGJ6_AEGTS